MALRPGALESMGVKKSFWRGKRVFITGQTGFKGAWLSLWLNELGARVTGYALKPPTEPSLFRLCRLDRLITSHEGDVRDLARLTRLMKAARPELVIHLAAQPIVRESYRVPVETFSTNVMGTVNVLEAARRCPSLRGVLVVTTDKVYEERGPLLRFRPFRENDKLGGHDPYASSKACAELVVQAYRRSYGLNAATARAGNVIGGGDWAADRLVPDFVRAISAGKKLVIRNPRAVRPWQHVLEPLAGYLLLAEKLYRHPGKYAQAWNFGPDRQDAKPVAWLAAELCRLWGRARLSVDKKRHPHEAGFLFLNARRAKKELGWRPKWDLALALRKVVDWTRAYRAGLDPRDICRQQIGEYDGF